MSETTKTRALRCTACGNDWTGRCCQYCGHDLFMDVTKYYPWLPSEPEATEGDSALDTFVNVALEAEVQMADQGFVVVRPRRVRRSAPPGFG